MMEERRVLLRNVGKISPTDLDDYVANDGFSGLRRALSMQPEEIIGEIERADLRGRGGAGFRTHLKLKFAAASESDQKYIVCNADEGEPGTNKDRVLLSGDPYSVWEGMCIAGLAIGAEDGILYLRAEYKHLLPGLEQTLEKAERAGFLGANLCGSEKNFRIQIRLGAGAYVCGEETAQFESIEGRRGEPRPRPPYPAVKGVFGKPTCLNNVETLANVTVILQKGAAWYRTLGTENSSGTKLFTLCGNVVKKGVYEFEMGIGLRELIYDVGGGVEGGRALLAVQTGGNSGAILNAGQIDMPLDIDHVSDAGGRLGCGTILVIDGRSCIIDIIKNNLEFYIDESCGKCTPCRVGLRRMLDMVEYISSGQGNAWDLERLEHLCASVKETAACGLGQSATVPTLSTIRNFPEAYQSHLQGKYCGPCNIPVKRREMAHV
ncbi:MAG: NADH-quinone oxidoreductase subunit L [Klebsiella quasipneumoniae]|nr:NADH-quinone oxidoreductase subunit L [Klebsiella quasipneumoniae]